MPADSPARSRALPSLKAVGAVVGVLLIGAGLAWNTAASDQWVWSTEEAREFAEAGAAVHNLQHDHEHDRDQSAAASHPHDTPAARSQAFLEAQQRYDRLSADLESARTLRATLGDRLIWSGFALTTVCGVGYLVAQRAD